MIVELVILLSVILGILRYLYCQARKAEQIKQLTKYLEDAKKSKERQNHRRYDDIADVKHRMQNYLRK